MGNVPVDSSVVSVPFSSPAWPVADGKAVELPCFGIFEMKEGKITAWRDYFDMSTYINGLS
jgi:ketosteroid isomerase-like protein